MILPFSFHPRMASFHLNCIGRILLLQQYQSEDRKGHRAVVSVELTRLSSVCIQKIGFGIRFTARKDFGESRTHALGVAVRCLNQLGYEIIMTLA